MTPRSQALSPGLIPELSSYSVLLLAVTFYLLFLHTANLSFSE